MEGKFFAENDPFALFSKWLEEAKKTEPRDAEAMALATADESGLPNVRMVLLKGFGPEGFVFYTNFESTKGRELSSNAQAAFVLYWKSLNRQIRVRGKVERLTNAEADAYFATRPRGAQIGAIASKQSRALNDRAELEAEIARLEAHYKTDVPCPQHWGGFRLIPLEIEFWAERPFRLHDRLQFIRKEPAASWMKNRLYP
jgi:pyridoxamine 5'-phosphate oxidase